MHGDINNIYIINGTLTAAVVMYLQDGQGNVIWVCIIMHLVFSQLPTETSPTF